MPVTRITREDMVEQSVTDFIRHAIFTERGYPAAKVELVDAFQPSRFEELRTLDKSYLALGFNFDNGGRPLELGSTLVQRTHMIEVWVLAETAVAGRNLANAVRDSLEAAGIVPLKDLTQPGQPVIDQLVIDPVRVERQPVPDPKPWQENVWLATIPVVDEFYLRLV